MDYLYAVPGMNVDKCKCGGSVLIGINMSMYYQICHTGQEKLLGRCHKCKRQKFTKFRRRLAPALVEK